MQKAYEPRFACRFWFALLASTTLGAAGLPRTALAQTAASAETWVGGIASGGFIAMRLNVRPGPRGATATIDFTSQGPERQALPVDDFSFDARRFHAEWREPAGTAVLDGTLDATRNPDSVRIEGKYELAGARGTFQLARGAYVSREAIGQWFGLYELEPGHLLWLGEVSELNRRAAFVDASSGRFGALYPLHPDTLFTGPTALLPAPRSAGLVAGRRAWPFGEVLEMDWRPVGASPRHARRLNAFTTEEVTFFNDTVRLTGTLVLPRSPGRHPAVVYLHGSGGGTRGYFSSLPFLLAQRGIASLVYDKRGSGGSSGNRHVSPFENLADDALAGVRLLNSRPEIDARRIGLYGHSQGGWVAPLAASRSNGSVAFVVTVAGPAKDYERQTNDEIRNVMREYGVSDADAQRALEHQALWWRVYRHRAPLSELAAANATAASQPWSRFLFNGARSVPPALTIDPPGAYDPEPVLRRLRVPMLAIYGGRDSRVLGAENARLMETYLRDAGNRDFTVKLYPTGNHDMIEVDDLPVSDALGPSRYVPGYFDDLLSWITTRAFGGRRPVTDDARR